MITRSHEFMAYHLQPSIFNLAPKAYHLQPQTTYHRQSGSGKLYFFLEFKFLESDRPIKILRFWVLGFHGFATYPNFKVLGFQGLATVIILRSWVFRVSMHIKILRFWVPGSCGISQF